MHEFNMNLSEDIKASLYDAVILAVPHKLFMEDGVEKIRSCVKDNSVIYDVKHLIPSDIADGRL